MVTSPGSEKFSTGTINPKKTNKQTKTYYILFSSSIIYKQEISDKNMKIKC